MGPRHSHDVGSQAPPLSVVFVEKIGESKWFVKLFVLEELPTHLSGSDQENNIQETSKCQVILRNLHEMSPYHSKMIHCRRVKNSNFTSTYQLPLKVCVLNLCVKSPVLPELC